MLMDAATFSLSGDEVHVWSFALDLPPAEVERGEAVPARARLEQLVEWVLPVAEEVGAAPFLAIPERNAAERQIARAEEGATLREIYAEQVEAGQRDLEQSVGG